MIDQTNIGMGRGDQADNPDDFDRAHPAPGHDERLVRRGDIPPHVYAHIRMQMGVASYRGVWPVGIRR